MNKRKIQALLLLLLIDDPDDCIKLLEIKVYKLHVDNVDRLEESNNQFLFYFMLKYRYRKKFRTTQQFCVISLFFQCMKLILNFDDKLYIYI